MERVYRKICSYSSMSITKIAKYNTYLSADVNKISAIIRKDFIVDEVNCFDKRNKCDNEFGYMSLHLICELSNERLALREYHVLKDIKFEVQIRTVLQHAWAEIEHDLGYKNSIGVPSDKNINRIFFRLASLLELAD